MLRPIGVGEGPHVAIDERLVDRLYRQAKGNRWRVPRDRFAAALEASAARAGSGQGADRRSLERYLASLHVEDLALACACAAGDEDAWEHFVLTQRPLLYRAADALDPAGGARDLADSLYADLFGLESRSGERQSLFRYFHGRSSLTTWLRAVLAQRFVDHLRAIRRVEALPDDESASAVQARERPIEPDRDRYLGLIRTALERAIASLAARDRLRLACYYAQDLTLAQTGRLLGEHEATSSRQLARTRATIRDAVERRLRTEDGLTAAEVAECLVCVTDDVGAWDVGALLDPGSASADRKESAQNRSS
jgi:RNA polymerase sigma-70 factor (ECF subfamily)